MSTLQFADTHNLFAFLSKPVECEGFEQIVDFLNAHAIKYALTINPTIYTSCIEQFWSTVKAKTVNGEVQLQALVDGKRIIVTEASVRSDLQLDDEEGMDCLLNATIFEELTRMDNVTDEAVNEEMDDSLERAATTATSLDAEQDRGNINKTQTKATPNEPSSPGTSSGGGPRRQDTMGDTSARTRFERVSKLSNDPLLARVLDLENTKTAQAQEITSLKLRVKKLEKKGGSRTHKLKRLYKIGRSARIVSSDEASLGDQEDASKQESKIDDIDKDADITLVDETQGRYDDDQMFDVSDLAGEEVFVAEQGVPDNKKDNVVSTVDDVAQISFDEETVKRLQAEFDEEAKLAKEKDEANVALIEEWNDIQAKIEADRLLSERLQAREQEELTIEERAKLFQQLLEKRRKHFAAKRAKEKRNRPPTKAQQRSIMCTYLKNMEGWKPKDLNKSFANIQELFEKAMKRVNTFVEFRTELVEGTKKREGSEKRAGTELEQEVVKKQKVDVEKETEQETSELQSLMKIVPDEEEVATDAIPLATKPPSIVDWKILKEGKISSF
ncbi:hypothetical protein Tco_0415056 [Tanacetum coccineum]